MSPPLSGVTGVKLSCFLEVAGVVYRAYVEDPEWLHLLHLLFKQILTVLSSASAAAAEQGITIIIIMIIILIRCTDVHLNFYLPKLRRATHDLMILLTP